MNQFDTQFWIQLIVYAVSFGTFYGKMTTELKYMKEKLDKHNSFQDRLTKVEGSSNSVHFRIDEIRDHIKECPSKQTLFNNVIDNINK